MTDGARRGRVRTTATFTKPSEAKGQPGFREDAYSEDGGRTWRWCSNGQVVPLDACREYGIPCDGKAQAAAREAETDAFLAQYRAQRAGRQPSDEERAEARAAHGPGVRIVDIITGEGFTT
jgi:hypothetical protein